MQTLRRNVATIRATRLQLCRLRYSLIHFIAAEVDSRGQNRTLISSNVYGLAAPLRLFFGGLG